MARWRDWLAAHWVIGAAFMAASLLAIAPVSTFALPTLLIFLDGPAYMLHQVEEHTGDRFRTFANDNIFHGREAITVGAVLVINLPLVWGVNLVALYAACAWGPAWGLAAPYLMLVNAVAHLMTSARLGRYNPGLLTGTVLFLPLSLATIWTVGADRTLVPQLAGAAVGILLHVAILAAVARRYRSLGAAPSPLPHH